MKRNLPWCSHWQTQGDESHPVMRKPAGHHWPVSFCMAVQVWVNVCGFPAGGRTLASKPEGSSSNREVPTLMQPSFPNSPERLFTPLLISEVRKLRPRVEEVTYWRVCELRLEFTPGLSANITSRDSPLTPLLPGHNHSIVSSSSQSPEQHIRREWAPC